MSRRKIRIKKNKKVYGIIYCIGYTLLFHYYSWSAIIVSLYIKIYTERKKRPINAVELDSEKE